MLDSAAVEVDRPPVRDLAGVERLLVIARVAVAVEVPRRVDERVHGVRLAPGRTAASGTGRRHEPGHLGEW